MTADCRRDESPVRKMTVLVRGCPDCGMDMMLREIRGMDLFYGCMRYPDCRATHGANPDGSPLGIPADATTRAKRIVAHEALDALWEDALRQYEDVDGGHGPEFLLRVARTRAYAWLGWRLGMSAGDCHIAKLDAFHCDLVVAACDGMTPELVRVWAKDKRYRARVDKMLRSRERDVKRHRRKVAEVVRKHGAEQVEVEFGRHRNKSIAELKRDTWDI